MKRIMIASGLLAAVATSTMGPPNVVIKDAHAMPDDFVTKSDMLVIKAIREGSREVDFVASTDTLDSHYEVIDQESWQLEDYLANPIVLYGHQAYELPIGQCTYVAVENGQLVCTIKFASAKANPMAEQVWQLISEKVLRAVSVGFKPVDGNYEMRDGDEVWVWSRSILKEISVVPIGANPDALARMKAAIVDRQKTKGALAPANVPAMPAEQPATNNKTGDAGKKGTESMHTIEQLQKMLDEAKAKGDSAATALAELNIKHVETERQLASVTAKATVTEKALADSDAKVKKLADEAQVRETEHTKACTDRDAAVKKANELEDKLVEAEVEAQVGVKISAGEKADFVSLRKSNENLYKSMLEKRPPMELTNRVTETDQKSATEGAKKDGKATPTAPGVNGKSAADAFNALGG